MAATSASVKTLQGELKRIHQDPMEGVVINLVDENNLFEWDVGIFGPPGTLYEGGYFKVCYMSRKRNTESEIRNPHQLMYA